MQVSIQEDTEKYIPSSEVDGRYLSFSEDVISPRRYFGSNKELGLMKEPLRFKTKREPSAHGGSTAPN